MIHLQDGTMENFTDFTISLWISLSNISNDPCYITLSSMATSNELALCRKGFLMKQNTSEGAEDWA